MEPGLTIAVDRGRLRPTGELDVSSAGTLLITLSRLEEDAHVIDLSGVTFLDSSGLRALLTAQRRYPHLRFENPSDAVRRILDVTGVGPSLLSTALT
jgi:anti-anti-sigma factor